MEDKYKWLLLEVLKDGREGYDIDISFDDRGFILMKVQKEEFHITAHILDEDFGATVNTILTAAVGQIKRAIRKRDTGI